MAVANIPIPKRVKIKHIVTIQPNCDCDFFAVESYTKLPARSQPPVLVAQSSRRPDGSWRLVLLDGHHRRLVAKKKKRKTILAWIIQHADYVALKNEHGRPFKPRSNAGTLDYGILVGTRCVPYSDIRLEGFKNRDWRKTVNVKEKPRKRTNSHGKALRRP